MSPKIVVFTCTLAVILAEKLLEDDGITRTMSEGVVSLGHNIVYGDEDMTIINEVSDEMEKAALKNKDNLNALIKPMKPEDVKCLMSVDSYCTKEMLKTKGVLIQALKEDCKQCTVQEKTEAGKVIASLMAYDSVAWKTFLTRYGGLQRYQRIIG